MCNAAAPQLLWAPRLRRSPRFLLVLCLVVIYGMWCERYVIVVTSLHRDFLPSAWGSYSGTFWDWSTMIGTIGLFLTMLLVSVDLSFGLSSTRNSIVGTR